MNDTYSDDNNNKFKLHANGLDSNNNQHNNKSSNKLVNGESCFDQDNSSHDLETRQLNEDYFNESVDYAFGTDLDEEYDDNPMILKYENESNYDNDDENNNNNNNTNNNNDDDRNSDDFDEVDENEGDSDKPDENDSFSIHTFLNYVSQYIQQQTQAFISDQANGNPKASKAKNKLFICILCKTIFKNTDEYLSHLVGNHQCTLTKCQEDYIQNENDDSDNDNTDVDCEFKSAFLIRANYKTKLMKNFDSKLDKKLNNQDRDNDNYHQSDEYADAKQYSNTARLLFIDNFKDLAEFISKMKKIYEQESHNHESNKIDYDRIDKPVQVRQKQCVSKLSKYFYKNSMSIKRLTSEKNSQRLANSSNSISKTHTIVPITSSPTSQSTTMPIIQQHSRNSCKKLKCPKCNWHYKYRETLDIHMKEKHSDSVLKCIYCLEHTQHPRLGRGEQYKCGYKPYRCETCDYSTTTKGNLSIHMQSDKHLNNVKEGKCPTQNENLYSTQSSLYINESNSSRTSSSDNNKEQFLNAVVDDPMTKNFKTANETIKTVNINSKSNSKYNNSNQPLASTNAISKQLNDSRAHMLSENSNDHHTELVRYNDCVLYTCQLCQVEFDNQSKLEKHLIDSHNVKNDEILKKLLDLSHTIKPNSQADLRFKDVSHGQVSPELIALSSTTPIPKKFHDHTSTTQPLSSNGFNVDSMKDSNTNKLNSHMKDPYKCNNCLNVFTKLDTLYRHMKDTGHYETRTNPSNGTKVYACISQNCNKHFENETRLDQHFREVHQQTKQHDQISNKNNKPEDLSVKHTIPLLSQFQSTTNDDNTNAAQLQFLQMLIQQSVEAYQAAAENLSSPKSPNKFPNPMGFFKVDDSSGLSHATANDERLANLTMLKNNSKKIIRRLLMDIGLHMVKHYSLNDKKTKQMSKENDECQRDDESWPTQLHGHVTLGNNNTYEDDEETFTCSFCLKNFSDALILKTHLEEEHQKTLESESILGLTSKFIENILNTIEQNDRVDNNQENEILINRLKDENTGFFNPVTLLNPLLMPFMMTNRTMEKTAATQHTARSTNGLQSLNELVVNAVQNGSMADTVTNLDGIPSRPLINNNNNNQQHQSAIEPIPNSVANRRKRTRITEDQLLVLRQHFDINKSPSDEQIADIAGKTELTSKVIKHWFRNTLFKERQKDKDSPYNFNNPPVTHLNLEEYEKTGKINLNLMLDQQQQPITVHNNITTETNSINSNTSKKSNQSAQRAQHEKDIVANRNKTFDSLVVDDRQSTAYKDNFYFYYNEENSNHEDTSSLDNNTKLPATNANENNDNDDAEDENNGGRHSNNANNHGHNGNRRTNRTKFTDYQIGRLTQLFVHMRYPKDDEIVRLSGELGLDQRVITVWFQNARQKARKTTYGGGDGSAAGSFTSDTAKEKRRRQDDDDDDDDESTSHTNDFDDLNDDFENVEDVDNDNGQLQIDEYNCGSSSTVTETSSTGQNNHKDRKHATSYRHNDKTMASATNGELAGSVFDQQQQTMLKLAMDWFEKYNKTSTQQHTSSQYDETSLSKAYYNGPGVDTHKQTELELDEPNDCSKSYEDEKSESINESLVSDSRPTSPVQYMNNEDFLANDKSDTKRLRTTILPEQQDYLMLKYQVDQNPSRKMLEEIAKDVNLKKRVVQVWFQNTRARERKGIIKVTQQVISKRCTHCGMVFRLRSAMENHLVVKHGDLVNKDTLNIDSYPDVNDGVGPLVTKESRNDDLPNVQSSSSKLMHTQKPLKHVPSKTFGQQAKQPSMAAVSPFPLVAPTATTANGPSPMTMPPFMANPLIQQPQAMMATQDNNFTQFYNTMMNQFQFQNFNPFNPYFNSFLPQAHFAQLMQQQFKQQMQQQMHDSLLTNATYSTDERPLDLSGKLDAVGPIRSHESPTKSAPTPQSPQQHQQNRRIRTQMSQFQVNIMKCIFMEYKTPTMLECDVLGREIGLKKRVVQVWFQNARAKEKKNPKCLKIDALNHEFSNEKCLLCTGVAYQNVSQQREHLFTKAHMNRLTQYLQNNLTLANVSIGKQASNSPLNSYDDSDDGDDVDDNDDGDNYVDYVDDDTETQTNDENTTTKPILKTNNESNGFVNHATASSTTPTDFASTSGNQTAFAAALQALSNPSSNTTEQQNFYNFLMYSNFLQNSQAPQMQLAALMLQQQQQQQQQDQQPVPLNSLNLTKEAQSYINMKLRDNLATIQFTSDGGLNDMYKLKKLNYDLSEIIESKYYFCKHCCLVWTHRDAFKVHGCCSKGPADASLVKIEYLKYKCVACDVDFYRVQEFLEHTTKNTHLDNCIKKRKAHGNRTSNNDFHEIPAKKLKS